MRSISQITKAVTDRVALSKEDGDDETPSYESLYKVDELEYIRQHGKNAGFDLFNASYASIVRQSERYIETLPPLVRDQVIQYTRRPDVNRDMVEAEQCGLAQTLAADPDWGMSTMYSIRALDYAFEHCPVSEEDLVTYRGLTIDELTQFSTRFGTYVSLTTNLHVAKQFAPKKCCILSIRVPKGSRILSVRNISMFPEQEELILPRGSIVKPTGEYQTIDNLFVYESEHIPPSSPKYDYELLFNEVYQSTDEAWKAALSRLHWELTTKTRLRRTKVLMLT